MKKSRRSRCGSSSGCNSTSHHDPNEHCYHYHHRQRQRRHWHPHYCLYSHLVVVVIVIVTLSSYHIILSFRVFLLKYTIYDMIRTFSFFAIFSYLLLQKSLFFLSFRVSGCLLSALFTVLLQIRGGGWCIVCNEKTIGWWEIECYNYSTDIPTSNVSTTEQYIDTVVRSCLILETSIVQWGGLGLVVVAWHVP